MLNFSGAIIIIKEVVTDSGYLKITLVMQCFLLVYRKYPTRELIFLCTHSSKGWCVNLEKSSYTPLKSIAKLVYIREPGGIRIHNNMVNLFTFTSR